MRQLFTLSCLCLALSGCVGGILLAGATGGYILYDKRGLSTIVDDRHITQTAQNLIYQDPRLEGRSHINVATYDHVALLVGQAQTPELRKLAYNLVSHVQGVNLLYNEITIAGSTSALQRSNDSWLTTKVRTAMLTKTKLSSSAIKIITENNIVYLMGDATGEQANLAANVARRISGVTKVVKVFETTAS